MIALYVHPKNSNHLRSHLRAIMALDHSRLDLVNEFLGKQSRPNFLLLTSLFNKILSTNLGACKPTFHTFYTSHLRWNSHMRHCFYHTDLRQNAAFHRFQEKLHSFNIQNHRIEERVGVPIVPVVSKMFRRSERSYGNATQTIANEPDEWDDLDRLDRVEFYPVDRDDHVNFEAIIWKDSQTTETIRDDPGDHMETRL